MSKVGVFGASPIEHVIVGYEVLPAEGRVRAQYANIEDVALPQVAGDTREAITYRVEGVLLSLVTIEDDYYAALMSGEPPWSPTKPAGMFLLEDLRHVVDAVVAGDPLEIGTRMKKFIL